MKWNNFRKKINEITQCQRNSFSSELISYKAYPSCNNKKSLKIFLSGCFQLKLNFIDFLGQTFLFTRNWSEINQTFFLTGSMASLIYQVKTHVPLKGTCYSVYLLCRESFFRTVVEASIPDNLTWHIFFIRKKCVGNLTKLKK